MNILVVSSSIITGEYTGGNLIIQIKTIEGMQRNGHKVTLLMYAPFAFKEERSTNIFNNFKSYIYPVKIKTLFISSLSKIFRVQFYPLACMHSEPFSKFKERLTKIITENKINLILCENIETAPSVQRFIDGIPIIIIAHDVLTDRYREFFKYRQIPENISKPILNWLGEIEIETIKKASHTICLSKDDRSRFIALGIPAEKLTTITGGATEIERFRPMPPDKNLQEKLSLTGKEPVLFFGGADSIQNIKALEDIAKHVLPPLIKEFPEVKMLVTGTLSRSLSGKRLEEQFPDKIINAGFVDNLEIYYSLADIVILPITVGSGIRLKVAEAMAAGKPIISTQKGIMGYDLKNNEHLIIEDNLSLFPEHIKKLLKDKSLQKKLGHKAREFMLSFDWKVMMDGYQNIYQEVFKQGSVTKNFL